MRVLVHSPAFLPRLGGLELLTADLARGLADRGEEVAVVTRTAGGDAADGAYRVVRDPSPPDFLRWTRWSDVVLHQNLSLRGLWPLAFVRRPLVVSHHSWYRQTDGSTALRDRLKLALVRRADGSIAVSPAIAAELESAAVVIENGYRDDLFRPDPSVARDGELLFVGRLVSDKGADLLLRALAILHAGALAARLTIVGDGPERRALERLVSELGLGGAVTFTGELAGQVLADAYRRHLVLAVPSRYEEPFGLVALEGIACGCAVVATSGGGLPRAVGPCGRLVPVGDVEALAGALGDLLEKPEERARLLAGAGPHLAAHGSARMIDGYLAELRRAAARRRRA